MNFSYTEEQNFKRLTAIDILFGNENFHLRRFADAA